MRPRRRHAISLNSVLTIPKASLATATFLHIPTGRPTDSLHDHQEGRFFHGYYRCYCYLPLYIFCAEHLLCARLRPSNQDAAAGCVDELEQIVAQIRARWPKTRIVIRGDAGFCREAIMAWCEANQVSYVLGLARNKHPQRALGAEMATAAPRMNALASRRVGSSTSVTARANPGRVSGGSSARLNICRTRPALALWKIGARIRITVPMVWLSFSDA